MKLSDLNLDLPIQSDFVEIAYNKNINALHLDEDYVIDISNNVFLFLLMIIIFYTFYIILVEKNGKE
jgi:hypothetical protein